MQTTLSIDPSTFNHTQQAAFDSIVDLLARLVAKYGPLIEDVTTLDDFPQFKTQRRKRK